MPRLDDETIDRISYFLLTPAPLPPAATQVQFDRKHRRTITIPRRLGGVKLTEAEIRRAYEGQAPPVLTLEMASAISGYAANTLKRLISEGRFKTSVKRKKPVLFWRDRFVQELMQG
jgi:hypothetical protein